MSTDKPVADDALPEPVAWRVGTSYFTKETSIPPALRVFDWEPLFTADQLRAAIARERTKCNKCNKNSL